MGSQTHQLDRMGRELKCPICLSLLQQAASLTCNHTFCRSCILQSMKSNPCCPICKVHTTRREVRAAPQMDSLVAIFVTMGSAAGLDITASQKLPSTNCSTPNDATSMGRAALSNITNCQKSVQNSKERLKVSNHTFKGAIPAKKRIQVPQPSTMEGELEANRDDIQSSPHLHVSAEKSGPTLMDKSNVSKIRGKRQNKRKRTPNESDVDRGHPSFSKRVNKGNKSQCLLLKHSCNKQLDIDAHGKGKETPKEESMHVEEYPPDKKKVSRRKAKDLKLKPCTQLVNNIEKGHKLPSSNDLNRRKLDTFFWLRDVSSQETDAIQGTQLTLTQSTLRPNFSDLKDSDNEFDLGANEEIAKATDMYGPATYDSDDFDWTQHPCSPEIRCSPSKNQDLIVDFPLEDSRPSAKEVQSDDNNACQRQSQKIVSTENLLESACGASTIAQDIHNTAVKEEKKSRPLGRMKAHHKTFPSVDLPLKDIRTSQSANAQHQQMLASYVRDSQAELPSCDLNPSKARKQIKSPGNCRGNAEKPSKPHKEILKLIQENDNAGCSSKPDSPDKQQCYINVLKSSKASDSTNRNNGKCSRLAKKNAEKTIKLHKRKHIHDNNTAGCSIKPKPSADQPCEICPSEILKLMKPNDSSKRNDQKPGKLPRRNQEKNCGDARNAHLLSKPKMNKDSAAPECVFCGSSHSSQITGSMMHYNQQGTPSAGLGHDGKLIHSHKHCTEWAPDVYFDGDQARNLSAEAARGLKIKCFSCGKRGAALGCCIKRCRRSYHYPCARALSCKWIEDCFIMLCPEHKDEKFPVKKDGSRRASSIAASKEVTIQQPAGVILEETSLKWACTQSSKWVLCGSALDAAGKNQLDQFAKLTGATVSKAWSSNVTHVIAGTDLHGAARRTMKFLMAILEGKWIVNLEWLAACIGEGKPVSEGLFEIQSDIHGATDGPKHGRLLAAGKGSKVFEKLQFYFMPDFLSSFKVDLQALVAAGGGGVLHRRPVAFVDDDPEKRRTIVVYNDEGSSSDKKFDTGKSMIKSQTEARELASLVGGNVVPHHWILDSIASSKVQPLE